MSDISTIDKNFKVPTKLTETDIKFYDVNESPFKVYGLFYEDGKFKRMPKAVAQTVNDGVLSFHANTAGGRVRFKTNSPYVAIFTKMSRITKMSHFPLTGSAGFDLYVGAKNPKYTATFVPPFDITDGYESIARFEGKKMRDITINFPLYSEVSQLYIGVSNTAQVLPADEYKNNKPIVYYGSSITHGGCASRPGNSYESIISRRLDCDFINLGFSGSAKGEVEFARYIAGLNMSAFVYDYDHNAPDLNHLKATHQKMFNIIRGANPNLPIIIMPRPKFTPTEDELLRFEVIKATYDAARANGDNNVYLLDNKTLMGLAGDDGTVDNCHPNDLGFMSMANAVGDILEKIL